MARANHISQTLLSLNPINFPEAWYANGLAHYFLQHLTEAENSARRGLAVDPAHQVPKLEYLLGTVLLERANYSEATGHLQAFLSLVTKPSEIAEAQRQLAEAARLSATRQLAAEKNSAARNSFPSPLRVAANRCANPQNAII